ncbi:MAG: MFS transporter, partial [Methanomassiliicoccus sp.]
MSSSGLGALLGALVVATYSQGTQRGRFLFPSMAVSCVALAVFARMSHLAPAALLMVVAGAGLVMLFSAANSAVQSSVEDELRGRVMGVWSLVFAASMPLGSLLMGTLAQKL